MAYISRMARRWLSDNCIPHTLFIIDDINHEKETSCPCADDHLHLPDGAWQCGILHGRRPRHQRHHHRRGGNDPAGNAAGGATNAWGWILFILMILFFVAIVCAVVWMEGLVRKIPIQYSNRPAAAKIRGNQDSNMPIKLNSASVIPVIFASTLLSLPTTILNFVTSGGKVTGEWVTWLNRIFNYTEPIGYAIYVILIFVFAFFYSFLQIDPDKVADNLKKNNAYIPGVKPGEATAQFISKTLFKVTLLGATYLTVLASLPIIVSWCFSGVGDGLPQSVQIGGTSLMIVVGVALETVKQIKTQAQSQEYKGFLK